MAIVEKSIDVAVPVRTAYDQWTQFETFPHFMEGVERVDQLDEKRLRWVAQIGTADREWDAEITEQVPDQIIAWRAVGGTRHDGRVRFTELGEDRTRIELELEHEPRGVVEHAGEDLGLIERRIAGDLARFKRFIEARGSQTGGWRGTI